MRTLPYRKIDGGCDYLDNNGNVSFCQVLEKLDKRLTYKGFCTIMQTVVLLCSPLPRKMALQRVQPASFCRSIFF